MMREVEYARKYILYFERDAGGEIGKLRSGKGLHGELPSLYQETPSKGSDELQA
jgi:hypothetical protein